MRSNQLSYPAMTVVKIVVEIEGLEPSLTEPESVVLPLHHISIWLPFDFGTANVRMFCENAKLFCKFFQKMLIFCRFEPADTVKIAFDGVGDGEGSG